MIRADLALVGAGDAHPQELIDAALRRARRAQLTTNAYTSVPAEAMAGTGPLAGIAIAVKDLIDQAGLPTTCGSGFLREPASATAPCLQHLEEAGATLLGRTNLHEFAFGFSSENDWFGPVRNPLDLSTSAGGSSGGSAAAVAAGAVGVAIGTDTGGSVRVPAAMCGVVGLKVTHGAVDTTGVYPLAPSLDTVGPIAATVTDAAIVYRALTGRVSIEPPAAGDLSGLRIGVPHPWADHPSTPEVRAAFTEALDRCSDLGAEIVDLDAPGIEPPGEITPGAYFEVARVHGERITSHPEAYGPTIRDRLLATLDVGEDDHRRALRWRENLTAGIADLFSAADVLVTPTVGAMHKRIGVDTIDVDGTPLHYRTVLSQFTALVNHAGLPALAAPLAAPGSPPPSLQIIGPSHAEDLLLGVALALEESGVLGTKWSAGSART